MFHQVYCFSKKHTTLNTTLVSTNDLYTSQKGYGFVTDTNYSQQELLQIPEINSGLAPWYWLTNQNLIQLISTSDGIYATKSDSKLMPEAFIPLSFKIDVPHGGNYKVSITLRNEQSQTTHAMIFSGRRRLTFNLENIPADAYLTKTCSINVSDIIPRGKNTVYTDQTLDLTLIGEAVSLVSIEVIEVSIPTLYIGGDSTVTDQNTAYPYHPGYSYCGWAQMLPAFLKEGIALTNHAHSGLTSETFRLEGHYSIIEKTIKSGDYFMFQFGHNDQKLPKLDAFGGYAHELTAYIHEIKEKGAIPILVTPLARNTWFADGTYNDLLADYALACIQVAEKEDIPLIDLHRFSMAFIKELGLEKAKAYFFPKDYTHTNDFGATYMARFIAQSLAALDLPYLSAQVNPLPMDALKFFTPNHPMCVPTPPADYEDHTPASFKVSFKDIDTSPMKKEITQLTSVGIISNQGDIFRPKDKITRVEILDWIIKTVGFVPMNVYNDYYTDVVGHEWYAGIVEVAHQNAIVPKVLIADGNFHPLALVTAKELATFLLNGYKCRKQLAQSKTATESAFLQTVASIFNMTTEELIDSAYLTREKAIYYVYQLYQLL